jgi:hypothetical protein
MSLSWPFGGVLELADRQDLGSCAARRVGSTPTFPTIALPTRHHHQDTIIKKQAQNNQ